AYPYDKVEGVGVPDFPAGAMENPGAITYRLDLLAIDPARTASNRLKACVSTVAHELTHMWWGDLATLAWWDDIWLNESFATFVGHKAEDAVHPEWDVWREFAAGSSRGFALDALASTHAIHSEVATAEEALQRFDAISYEKGATVLRMIESYLGDEGLRVRVGTGERAIKALYDGERGVLEIARGGWLHPNAGAAGLCRYALDAPLRRRLLANLDALAATERLWLVDNAWALAFAGRSTLADYLALLDALRAESDRVVLRAISAHLRWLATHVPSSEVGAAVASRARDLFAHHLARLGWDPAPGETEDDLELRAIAIGTLGELAGTPDVREAAASRVAAHLAGRPQPPDVIGAALRIAAREGDAALARTLLARLTDSASGPQEQRRILDALPVFRERAAVETAIAALFDGTVRDQDLPGMFGEGFRNASARAAFWQAFRDGYAKRIAPLEAFVRQGCVMGTGQLTP